MNEDRHSRAFHPARAETFLVCALALGAGWLSLGRVSQDHTPCPALQGEEREAFQLDINRATREELALLPGIGLKRAQAIIEQRRQEGPFRNRQELIERVWGIGPEIGSNLQPPHAFFGPPNSNVASSPEADPGGER